MLRISKLADYGTVVMVYLARDGFALSNAATISEQTHISQPTVSKILKKLAQADLLCSIRGSKGGYKLGRDATDISVADIINALEDRAGLTECSENHGQCSLQTMCDIKGNWRLINDAVARALASVSLKALASKQLAGMNLNFNPIFEVE